MKVYTKIELVWDGEGYVESSSESYEYEGDFAEAKGGGGQQQTTQKTEPWEKQQPYLEDLFKLGQQYQQGGIPDTTQSEALTGTAITGYGEAAEGVTNFLDPIQAANQSYATGSLLDPSSNPALQKYIDLQNQSITRSFTEGVNPAIEGAAASAGNIGSSRQGIAQGLAAGRSQDAVARSTQGLTTQAYGQGLAATLQAQSLSPAFANAFGIAPQFQTNAANLQYGLDTQADQAELQRLQAYQQLIGGNYGGTTTGTAPSTQTGGLSGALGGAATGATIGSAVPGIGTGIGAAVGGIAGYFS